MVPDALARVFEMMDTPPIQNNYALFYIRKYIFSIVLNSGFTLIVRSSSLIRKNWCFCIVCQLQDLSHPVCVTGQDCF